MVNSQARARLRTNTQNFLTSMCACIQEYVLDCSKFMYAHKYAHAHIAPSIREHASPYCVQTTSLKSHQNQLCAMVEGRHPRSQTCCRKRPADPCSPSDKKFAVVVEEKAFGTEGAQVSASALGVHISFLAVFSASVCFRRRNHSFCLAL
jgi:hypothetical protein